MTEKHGKLEFDCTGIPIFDGDVSLLEERKQRCMDEFYGRTATERQKATTIDLRKGTGGMVLRCREGVAA